MEHSQRTARGCHCGFEGGGGRWNACDAVGADVLLGGGEEGGDKVWILHNSVDVRIGVAGTRSCGLDSGSGLTSPACGGRNRSGDIVGLHNIREGDDISEVHRTLLTEVSWVIGSPGD
jgi:hypothetical protein